MNFDHASCTFSLTASSHIPARTEVSLSYIDSTLPGVERRAQLREKWAFECECPSCTLSPSKASVSDMRRAEIREWFEQPKNKAAATIPLRRSPDDSQSNPLPKLLRSTILPSVQRYVALSDAEGFLHTDYLYSALERGAFAFALLGERDEFLQWARRAKEQLGTLGATPAAKRANFSVEGWAAAIVNPEGTLVRWAECK